MPSKTEIKRALNGFGIDVGSDGELKHAAGLLRLRAAHFELVSKLVLSKSELQKLKHESAELEVIHNQLEAKQITESEAGERWQKVTATMNTTTAAPPLTEADHNFNVGIADGILKKTDDGLAQQEELVSRVVDARKALDLALNTFRKDSLEYLDELDSYLLRLRQTRMALDTESKMILAQCADVRKFFLSDAHGEQVKRVGEFAECCQKLKELKESGFLDAIADTILKLEEKK